jgi:hypothetical protein
VLGGIFRRFTDPGPFVGPRGLPGPAGPPGATGLAGVLGIAPGIIVGWSGKPADVPAGWALCDGANGTPDLRDRFIVAVE